MYECVHRFLCADLHPVRSLFLIWLGRKRSRESNLFLDVSFPVQVYTCCSSHCRNIHLLLCLKVCTPPLEYFYQGASSYKFISAGFWNSLNFLPSLFHSLQRKWTCRFLIMRKPSQLFTFSKSSLNCEAFICTSHTHDLYKEQNWSSVIYFFLIIYIVWILY